MLLLDAPADEIAALGRALAALAVEDPIAFACLFDPLGPRHLTKLASSDLAAMLRRFGLAEGNDEWLFGRHRIRRRGERLYVMEVGDVAEYLQDVWPETDALLAALDAAPPGVSVLDVGTGCGIVAIEAAARGHCVVATDLYPTALDLARFNAALNRVGAIGERAQRASHAPTGSAEGASGTIDYRLGHLFEPVANERFDLVLAAPHYTRVAAQLRLEVLRDGPRHLTDGGHLVLATVLEWQDGAPPSVVPALIAREVAGGASVTVAPIPSPVKRHWFTDARAAPPIAGLVSRHRFAVTVETQGGRLSVTLPSPEEQVAEELIPLSRLTVGRDAAPGTGFASGATAVVAIAADVARLGAVLDGLAAGDLTLAGAIPSQLLDACRFGARACVDGTRGAAGAILDGAGGVRPCTHGAPIARADHAMSQVVAIQAELAVAAAARRGCATCPAASVCSHCLFPFAVDEAVYCDFIRAHAGALPRLHRLIDLLGRRHRARALGPSLRIKIGAAPPPLVAGDPIHALFARWRACEAWLVLAEGRRSISLRRDGQLVETDVDPQLALLADRVTDGASAADLEAVADLRLSGKHGRRAVARLAALLG